MACRRLPAATSVWKRNCCARPKPTTDKCSASSKVWVEASAATRTTALYFFWALTLANWPQTHDREPVLGRLLRPNLNSAEPSRLDSKTSHSTRSWMWQTSVMSTSEVVRSADFGPEPNESYRVGQCGRLGPVAMTQAFSALTASPGARGYYDQLKACGAEHNAALRQLANRLVGILHGRLKTRTRYDEATAWSHRVEKAAA